MAEKSGTFGTVAYTDNNLNIEITPDTLGSIALTARDGRIECHWDGNQWVCSAVTFSTSNGESQSQQAPTSV
jgi:hypothetical protein